MPPITIRRGYADTPEGQIHYAVAGQGKPVLLLHQTPRSWDEYRDVLPILGRKYRAIAMDTIGFGDSYRLKGEASIEVLARGVIQLMDALSIRQASIVGHHTGGVIAVEVAAAYPDRVEKLILSSTPYVDAEDRERRKTRPPIDEVEEKPDGSHLTELWQRRMPFYPKVQARPIETLCSGRSQGLGRCGSRASRGQPIPDGGKGALDQSTHPCSGRHGRSLFLPPHETPFRAYSREQNR